MSLKKSLLCLVFSAVCSTVNASSISGNLADESARFNLSLSAEPFVLEAGGVYDSVNGQSAFGGIMIESKSDPVEIGVGARARIVDAEFGDNGTGYSFGFGGYYRYVFPAANRFSFYLSAYYYPELLSYENILRQYEIESRIEYFATENLKIYISYNLNAINYIQQEEVFRLDEDVNFGVAVYF